jgi:FAD/FMN-containing dehydrogenase
LYVLIETCGHDEDDAEGKLLSLFEIAAAKDLVTDGVVAKSIAEKAAIWNIREDSDLVAKSHGAMLSYDVSIETNKIGTFVENWQAECALHFPEVPSFIFGHLGDGNLHVCLSVTAHQKRNRTVIDDVFYDVIRAVPGSSMSAEHGIGLSKRQHLYRSRSATSLTLMHQIKKSLDPLGIMNPGKLLA